MPAEKIETRLARSDTDFTFLRTTRQICKQLCVCCWSRCESSSPSNSSDTICEGNILCQPEKGESGNQRYSFPKTSEFSFDCSILVFHHFNGLRCNLNHIQEEQSIVCQSLEKNPIMKVIAAISCDPTSTVYIMGKTGDRMFLAVYHAPSTRTDLNSH